MPIPNGVPLYCDPYLRDAGVAVFEGTVSSGNVTKVGGVFSCGNFSTGVAAVTFPPCKKVTPLGGESNTDNSSSTSRHRMKLTAIDATAGTATLRSIDENNGATENPADGTFRFSAILSW